MTRMGATVHRNTKEAGGTTSKYRTASQVNIHKLPFQHLQLTLYCFSCFHAHLNGVYYAEQGAKEAQGIVWRTWLGWKTLKSSTMKIRSNKF